VNGLIAEIEKTLASRPPETAKPPPVAGGSDVKKPFIKRHWWIIPTTLVVAGVAIGVGVWGGLRKACLDTPVRPECATWNIDLSNMGLRAQ
jgi:hypothetical protein